MRHQSSPAVHDAQGVPFASAAEAWFWAALGLIARRDGAALRAGLGLVARPCEPLDVLRSIDRLYRNRVIDRDHLAVLADFGERSYPPDGSWPREARAARLWEEAMAKLEPALRRKGIVA